MRIRLRDYIYTLIIKVQYRWDLLKCILQKGSNRRTRINLQLVALESFQMEVELIKMHPRTPKRRTLGWDLCRKLDRTKPFRMFRVGVFMLGPPEVEGGGCIVLQMTLICRIRTKANLLSTCLFINIENFVSMLYTFCRKCLN